MSFFFLLWRGGGEGRLTAVGVLVYFSVDTLLAILLWLKIFHSVGALVILINQFFFFLGGGAMPL